MQSAFWQFLEESKRTHPTDRLDFERASSLLAAERPESLTWRHFGDMRDAPLPLVTLLESLRGGDFYSSNPCRIKVDPAKVKLTFLDGDEFIALLLRRDERGAITFFWEAYNSLEDAFHVLGPDHARFVTLVREVAKSDGENGAPKEELFTYAPYSAAALGFLRDGELEVFPFPEDWPNLVEKAYWSVKRMTAREKAKLDLEPDLATFVRLLGYDAVSSAVKELR